MNGPEIERLIQLLAKLRVSATLGAARGPRFAQRRDTVLKPCRRPLTIAADKIVACGTCGNLDTTDPCMICADTSATPSICVFEEVANLWAIERSGAFKALSRLGGVLSALDGSAPKTSALPVW